MSKMNSIFHTVIHDSNARDFDKLILNISPIELILVIRKLNKYYYNLTKTFIKPAIERDIETIDIMPMIDIHPENWRNYAHPEINTKKVMQSIIYNKYDVCEYIIKNYTPSDFLTTFRILSYEPTIDNEYDKEQYLKIGKLLLYSLDDAYVVLRRKCNDNKLLAAQRLLTYYPNINIRKNSDCIFYECCIRRHLNMIKLLCSIVPNYSFQIVGVAYNPIVKN